MEWLWCGKIGLGKLVLFFALPDTEDIQDLIIEYLEYIINVEYPVLRNKVVPPEGNQIVIELQNLIYNYEPVGNQQLTLYNEAINLLNLATSYRVDGLDSGIVG